MTGRIGGEIGWAPLAPVVCRRLACDATITPVVVGRQLLDARDRCQGDDPKDPTASGVTSASSLEGLVRAVLAKLPPVLGGAPSQPLDVGRSSRVVTAAQRAVHEGGWRLLRGPDGRFTATHHIEDTRPPGRRETADRRRFPSRVARTPTP